MSLKIIPKTNDKIPQDQRVFGELMDQIEELNLEKEIEREKLEKLAQAFESKIPQLRRKFAASQVEIARKLAAAAENLDLNRKQVGQIEELIVYFCRSAFLIEPPDDELIAFFDHWSDDSYAELFLENESDLKESLADQIREMYGVDVDLSDLELSPDTNAELQDRIREQLEAREALQNQEEVEKPKSEKRLQKEAAKRNREAEKLKSIRSIYIALAKLLHPDMAASDAEKAQKEEWMKKVTIAYTERDLSTLLKLEMQWITTRKGDWDQLPADKVKAYISSLKTQVKDLQTEISRLYRDPRFAGIADVAHLRENFAMQEINKREKAFKTWIGDFRTIIHYLQENKDKTRVMSCVQQIRNGIRTF